MQRIDLHEIKHKYWFHLTIRIHKVIHTLGITLWIMVEKKRPETDFPRNTMVFL